MTLQRPLDYETQTTHVILFVVCDATLCTEEKNITVHVENRNDPPVFSPTYIDVELVENLVGKQFL